MVTKDHPGGNPGCRIQKRRLLAKQERTLIAVMFTPRRNRNMIQAAGTTLSLIYYQTVYNLRTAHRNAVLGLILTIAQSAVFLMAFLVFYLAFGVRQSPIRGDFILFILSGIITFMLHVQTVGAVSNSHSVGNKLARHTPLTPAVLISAAALAVLYRQTVSCIAILCFYHVIVAPLEFESWPGCLAMFLLSWFCGACVGLILLGLRPWSRKTANLLTTIYQRVNMFGSGKMFVANILPGLLLPWFLWNPLFHIIDQMRGFVFINYSPLRTSPSYALWFAIAALMIGLLINFTTRKYESISWGAAA